MRPRKNEIERTNSLFKKLRLNAKLTQDELALEIGVAVSTIRRWEQGKTEPTMTISQMTKFCNSVKTNFEEMPQKFSYQCSTSATERNA